MAQIYDNGLNPALPGYKGNAAPSPATPPPGSLIYNGVVNPTAAQRGMAPVSSSPNVPVNQVMPTQALNLPQPSTDTSEADGMAATAKVASKTLEDYIKELTPKETETSKKASAIASQLESLLGQSAGQSEALLKAENQLGLPALQKQLADLNSNILTTSAAYDKRWFDQEQRIVPMSSIVGTQAAIRRSQAADIGFLNARALGLSGQITAAQDTAKRAVEMKYAPILEQIDIKLKQLEVIQPILDKEEKVRAQALQMKYEDDRIKAQYERDKAKMNLSLALEAGVTTSYANRNGEFFDTRTGQAFETPEDFFKAAGVTSFEEAYRRGIVTDYTQDKVADREFALQARATYWDAGINPSDNMETVKNKILSSKMYQQSIAPKGGGGGGGSGSGYVSPGSITDSRGKPIKLTAGQADAIAGFDTTVSLANETISLLNTGVQTGPVAGRTLALKKLVGGSDPRQLALEQKLAKLKADFMKSLSGAAVSEQEVARLEKFLPSITDQEDVIMSKLNTIKQEASRTKSVLLSTLGSVTQSSTPDVGSVIEHQGKKFRVIDAQGNLEEVQ